MSLTGLFCAILFTILLRVFSRRTENILHSFCDELEYRVLFQTPESIASEQLEAITQQTVTLDKFNADLAATISNALTIDLPKALSETLDPVMKQVMDSSGSSVGSMVKGLGDSLNEKLNESLNEIAATLTGVNTSLVSVSESLGSSGESVSIEINKAITDLSSSIGEIRKTLGEDAEASAKRRNEESKDSQEALSDLLLKIEGNTREGAREMREAAESIATAASNLKDSIAETGEKSNQEMASMLDNINEEARASMGAAGTDMAAGIREASETILSESSLFTENMQGVIAGPIEELEKALGRFSDQLKNSSNGLEEHGDKISSASAATDEASDALTVSADSLKSVADPILKSVQNIEQMNKSISTALTASSIAMELSKATVEGTLSALKSAVSEFDVIIKNAAGINEKLGDAFLTVKKGLEESQNEIRTLQMGISDEMARGISSLRSAVEGLEEYKDS